MHLGNDLRMKSDRLEAATWYTETVPGFRNGPYDVAVKITNEHGQVLCSNDHTKQVALLSVQESEETGVFSHPTLAPWVCF